MPSWDRASFRWPSTCSWQRPTTIRGWRCAMCVVSCSTSWPGWTGAATFISRRRRPSTRSTTRARAETEGPSWWWPRWGSRGARFRRSCRQAYACPTVLPKRACACPVYSRCARLPGRRARRAWQQTLPRSVRLSGPAIPCAPSRWWSSSMTASSAAAAWTTSSG